MLRFGKIMQKNAGLLRVPVFGAIVTHGKGIGMVPEKKPVLCIARGDQIPAEIAADGIAELSSNQKEICISQCQFACL